MHIANRGKGEGNENYACYFHHLFLNFFGGGGGGG